MNLKIRKISKNDYTQYLEMAKDFYNMPCCDHNVEITHFENAFNFCLNDNPYARLFMIEYNSQIVGYGNISLSYSIEAGGNVVWLEELYIKSEYRSLGIGKAFFDYIYQNYPAKRYRLEVTSCNTKAIDLYKKLGYIPLNYNQMIKDID